MIRYLIKNNFKLMFRNTWSIVAMIFGPILVIAVLSSAFSVLLKSYEGVDEFAVGFRMEEDNVMAQYIDGMVDVGAENGIHFYDYPQGEPMDVMEKNGLAAFVEFGTEEYTIFKSADYEIEGITLEYLLGKVMNEGINGYLETMGLVEEVQVDLPIRQLDFMPSVNAKDYYGIAYIVYFGWCGMICATGMLSSEKKYGIERKLQVSNISSTKLYIAKLVPITITVCVGMGVATILSAVLLDIHWGNILLSSIILAVMMFAGSAFGMMLYCLFHNLAITMIALFSLVWVMGFFGGSFETYMFSAFPESLKLSSPIYHVTRALVEISCMGQSEYTGSALIYSGVMGVVCSVIGILVCSARKRGKA